MLRCGRRGELACGGVTARLTRTETTCCPPGSVPAGKGEHSSPRAAHHIPSAAMKTMGFNSSPHPVVIIYLHGAAWRPLVDERCEKDDLHARDWAAAARLGGSVERRRCGVAQSGRSNDRTGGVGLRTLPALKSSRVGSARGDRLALIGAGRASRARCAVIMPSGANVGGGGGGGGAAAF